MKVTVLGASGHTGVQVVLQSLAAGHEVVVLVPEATDLMEDDHRLTVVRGDATDPDAIAEALGGSDALVSALGGGADRKSTIAGDAARVFISSAEDAGVGRLIVVSAFGVGDSLNLTGPLNRTGMWMTMHAVWRTGPTRTSWSV